MTTPISSATNQGSEAVKDTAGERWECDVPLMCEVRYPDGPEEWFVAGDPDEDGVHAGKYVLEILQHLGQSIMGPIVVCRRYIITPDNKLLGYKRRLVRTHAGVKRFITVRGMRLAPAAPLTPPDPVSNADETKE